QNMKVLVADLNEDMKPDLFIWDELNGRALLGIGDGTFQALAPFMLGYGTIPRLAIADLNQDRHLDLAVVVQQSVLSLHLGVGDGTFVEGQSYSVPRAASAIAAADFDRDGLVDLVVGNGDGATL